jgi:hypothetical protein
VAVIGAAATIAFLFFLIAYRVFLCSGGVAVGMMLAAFALGKWRKARQQKNM